VSLRRRAFLALAGSAATLPCIRAFAQDEADPASTAQSESLRVLLGQGDAQSADHGFIFDGQPYRGTFVRLDDGSIVNVVGIEQYLYSVVPREMSPGWPAAALQAQAICARTYVLQRSSPRRNYDLVPSELDQVYRGVLGESPAGRSAVDSTAGQVLRFGRNFASVAYSSCCGGHTESSADAWGGAPIAYLGGVACRFCNDSPNYRWSAQVPVDDLVQRLGAAATFGNLRDVRIAGTDGSGRARAFDLIGDGGSVTVKGTTFRSSVGARVVRSLLITRLSVDRGASAVAFEGGGLGHGVGLCQWGARGIALAGRNVRDILAFYFPGTGLTND
jgi:stage II sporulation protein D